MHSTTSGSTQFFHHGDYSGDVRIVCGDQPEVSIPAADLLAFAAEWVRSQKIHDLEEADPSQLLGYPLPG